MNEPAYECPICHAVSHHPQDRLLGYCGHCHAHTRSCCIGACPKPPAIVQGNISLCRDHFSELELGGE